MLDRDHAGRRLMIGARHRGRMGARASVGKQLDRAFLTRRLAASAAAQDDGGISEFGGRQARGGDRLARR